MGQRGVAVAGVVTLCGPLCAAITGAASAAPASRTAGAPAAVVSLAVRLAASNTGQPTISVGASGDAVLRLQRALRRTGSHGVAVDGIFGPVTDAAVRDFQRGAGLHVDGIVGPVTWAALPDGASLPILQVGSTGSVVRALQRVLTNGAPGQWNVVRHRRHLRTRDQGLGGGLPALGAGRRRRDRRRPDLGGLPARGGRHPGVCGHG
jgi:hypothetical protein